MSDLVVDLGALEDSAAKLARLKTAFKDLPHTVSEQSPDWGSSSVAGAMHEFATNWDYRRDKLDGQLDVVGQKIEGTVKAFREADTKLAHEARGSK